MHTGTYTLSVQNFDNSGDDFPSNVRHDVCCECRRVCHWGDRTQRRSEIGTQFHRGGRDVSLLISKEPNGDWGTLADPYLSLIYDASGSSISGTYDHDSGAGKNSSLSSDLRRAVPIT